jgi:hypothetical protein
MNPVHGSASRCFLGAHRGNIVLGVTGNDAGLTAGATVEINYHFPSMSHELSSCFRRLLLPAELFLTQLGGTTREQDQIANADPRHSYASTRPG